MECPSTRPTMAVDREHAVAQSRSYERINSAAYQAVQATGKLPARPQLRCCVDGALLAICNGSPPREMWKCPICGDYYEAQPYLCGPGGPAIVESGNVLPSVPAETAKTKAGKNRVTK